MNDTYYYIYSRENRPSLVAAELSGFLSGP